MGNLNLSVCSSIGSNNLLSNLELLFIFGRNDGKKRSGSFFVDHIGKIFFAITRKSFQLSTKWRQLTGKAKKGLMQLLRSYLTGLSKRYENDACYWKHQLITLNFLALRTFDKRILIK